MLNLISNSLLKTLVKIAEKYEEYKERMQIKNNSKDLFDLINYYLSNWINKFGYRSLKYHFDSITIENQRNKKFNPEIFFLKKNESTLCECNFI